MRGSARTRQNVRPRRRSVYASRGVGVRKTAGQSQDRRGERVRRYLSASDSDHPAGHGRELTIGTIDPEQTGGFHGFRPSPSDIIGAGATRQRHGDAVAKAPSAKGPSVSYGAQTVREEAIRASTTTVAVSVAPPTKAAQCNAPPWRCGYQRRRIRFQVGFRGWNSSSTDCFGSLIRERFLRSFLFASSFCRKRKRGD
jgi:hypothetical protein